MQEFTFFAAVGIYYLLIRKIKRKKAKLLFCIFLWVAGIILNLTSILFINDSDIVWDYDKTAVYTHKEFRVLGKVIFEKNLILE
jgi:hypothetical protein